MFSGIWPRGSRSAPGRGNTGITSGRSAGPRYSALIGMNLPGKGDGYVVVSGEQDRRQPLAPLDGGLIRPAPRLEKLHQLLARTVVVPLAIALDDSEQLLGRFAPIARRVQRRRKIEARLVIERVRGDFLLQLADRADRFGLLGQIDRGLHGFH